MSARTFARTSASSAGTPGQVLHLIGQHSAWGRAANHHLKRVVFDLCRQGTADHQARLAVIRGWTQYERWTAPSLLVAGLRGEVQPYEVAGIGHIVPRHYQISLPSGGPKSIS